MVRTGDPVDVVAALAAEIGARTVYVTGEHTPYARRRDAAVAARLAADGVAMTSAGSCHAVAPGTLRTQAGTPYQVFTPFLQAWREHLREQVEELTDNEVAWIRGVRGEALGPAVDGVGEVAVRAQWAAFRDGDLASYDEGRDRPDLEATSELSVPLRFGEVHPLTLVRDVLAGPSKAGPDRFLAELAWRDFHADVLWHHPTAWRDLRGHLAGLAYDEPGDAFVAWQEGRTGYPLVDAGMRQLLATGWMHNRVRMVVASFLVKDLHLPWQLGARHFLDHLLDGDLASNNGNWQWAAGTGTDAAPYHRVFNPTTQAKRFDPQGRYVRRWVPELAHLSGAAALEPWSSVDGYDGGCPQPIVDHAVERRETLARWEEARHTA